MQVTIQKSSYLLSVLDQVNYYEKIANEFNKDLMEGAGAAGFEPSIYEKFVSEKEAKNISKAYILEYFDKGNAKISSDDFRSKLITHLKQSAIKQNIEIDESDPAFLNYVNKIVNSYGRFFAFPFLQYAVMAIDLLDKITPILFPVCIVFMVSSYFFLVKLKLQREQFVQFVVSSLIGGGLMCVVIPSVIHLIKLIERVSLSPQCFYDFFNRYIYGYLDLVLLSGCALIILAVLVYLIHLKKAKGLKQVKSNEKQATIDNHL
ncbi:hypothetical protein [Amedibacillus sp. YH-ame10]